MFVDAGHVEKHDERIGTARIVGRRKIDVQIARHSQDWRKDAAVGPVIVCVVDHAPAEVAVDALEVHMTHELRGREQPAPVRQGPGRPIAQAGGERRCGWARRAGWAEP